MRKYQDSISSAINGLPVYQAQIRVLKADGSAANLYSDNGLTSLAQPVLTNGLGEYFFFIADGTYTLRVANPDGTNSIDFPNIEMYEDARNVSVPAGEGGLTIPSSVTRANTLLGFDAGGLPIAVAAAASDLATIASIAPQIVTVANNVTPIGIVATDLTGANRIGTVATNIANVNAVATSITNVNSVAGALTNINTVATNLTNINTVATNIANVNATAGSIANVNAVANDMALGAGASFILRAPQAAVDAANSAASAASYATAFGAAFASNRPVYGFDSLVPTGSTWPNNSVIWTGFTAIRDCTLDEIETQIVASGAIDLVVATGTLTGSTPTVTKVGSNISLSTPPANSIMRWISPADGGTGWSGSVFIPAGASLFFSLPATTGATVLHDTTLTGYTEYAATGGPFSGSTRTLAIGANRSIRTRVTVTEMSLQVPRSGLVDAPVVAAAAISATPAKLITSNVVQTAGASMSEYGLGQFSNNQLATITPTFLADDTIKGVTLDIQSVGSGSLDLLILRGTAPNFEIVSSTTLTVGLSLNYFSTDLGNFTQISVLAGQTVAVRLPSGGPTLYNVKKPGNTFYYGATPSIVTGAALLTPIPDSIIRCQVITTHGTIQVQKINLGSELQGLDELATPATPHQTVVYLTIGQSLFVGAASSPLYNANKVTLGHAYQYYPTSVSSGPGSVTGNILTTSSAWTINPDSIVSGTGIPAGVRVVRQASGDIGASGATYLLDTTLGSPTGAITISAGYDPVKQVTGDPIGPSFKGSIWPSFINSNFAWTGDTIMLVCAAVGGSGLGVAALGGNWASPTKSGHGSLAANAVSMFLAATATLEATATFTASIAGTVMTVTGSPTGTIYPGHLATSTNTLSGTTILKQISGPTGGAGTYQVSISQTVASASFTMPAVPWRFGGILMDQGQSDGDAINNGTPLTIAGYGGVPMTGAIWKTAFQDLDQYFRGLSSAGVTLGVGSKFPFILCLCGPSNGVNSTNAGYAAIRTSQIDTIRTTANIYPGFEGALNFPDRFGQALHYDVSPNNEYGHALGKRAAFICAGSM